MFSKDTLANIFVTGFFSSILTDRIFYLYISKDTSANIF